MKYINPIDQDVPALVSDITSTIRSQELVTRYHDSIIGIEQAKQSYIHQMATQIDEINSEKLQFLGESLPASRDELKKLYKEYFVHSKYYGEIIQSTEWCPYCEVRLVKTLDHFLPQKYSTLTIVSQNLIPACRDCNTDKRTTDSSIFHPYYDQADWQSWLSVQLEFANRIIPTYQCIKTQSLSESLFNRIKSTVNFLDLMDLYQSYANSEIQENIHNWNEYLRRDKSILKKTFTNCLLHSNHCWKGALYQSLLKQIDELFTFLNGYFS